MIPRPPLGASRPLSPVIGRGGGPMLRRPPLTLLWRRLRPRPIALAARARPLHLHAHWTLNVRLLWSLAPASVRAPGGRPRPALVRRAWRPGDPFALPAHRVEARPASAAQAGRRTERSTLWRRILGAEALVARRGGGRRTGALIQPEIRIPRPGARPAPPGAVSVRPVARTGRAHLDQSVHRVVAARARPLHLHARWTLNVRLLRSLPPAAVGTPGRRPGPGLVRRAWRPGDPLALPAHRVDARPARAAQADRLAERSTLWRRILGAETLVARRGGGRRAGSLVQPEIRIPQSGARPAPRGAAPVRPVARPHLDQPVQPAPPLRGAASPARPARRGRVPLLWPRIPPRLQRFRTLPADPVEVRNDFIREPRRAPPPRLLLPAPLTRRQSKLSAYEQRLPLSTRREWTAARLVWARGRPLHVAAPAADAGTPRQPAPGPVIARRRNARFPPNMPSAIDTRLAQGRWFARSSGGRIAPGRHVSITHLRRRSGTPAAMAGPASAAPFPTPALLPRSRWGYRSLADAVPPALLSLISRRPGSAVRLRQLIRGEATLQAERPPERSTIRAAPTAWRRAFAPAALRVRARPAPPFAPDRPGPRPPSRSAPMRVLPRGDASAGLSETARPQLARAARSISRPGRVPIPLRALRPAATARAATLLLSVAPARRSRQADVRFGRAMANRLRSASIAFAPALQQVSGDAVQAALPGRRERRAAGRPAAEAQPGGTAFAPALQRRGAMRLPVTPARGRRARPSGSPLPDSLPARRMTAAQARPPVRLVHAAAAARNVRRHGRRPVDLLWAQGGRSTTTIVQGGFEQVAASEPVRLGPTELPHRPVAMPPPPDMSRLVDEVIARIDRQARTERLRRGI